MGKTAADQIAEMMIDAGIQARLWSGRRFDQSDRRRYSQDRRKTSLGALSK